MIKQIMLVATILLLPLRVNAADPVGDWRMDSDGFQEQFLAMMAPQLADLPAAMKEQMQGMMMSMIDDMKADMSGVATLSADGSASFLSDSGEQQSGSWEQLSDNEIRINPSEGDSVVATIDGDRLTSTIDDPESGMSMEMVWIRQ